MPNNIRIEGVSKSLEGEVILDRLNLEIPGGKFFALLGPSGCGKTTLLRLIAGLEEAEEGNIFLGNEDITYTPIYKRRIKTVFQHYALFPHLSVFENVAYSLRLQSIDKAEIAERVESTLKNMRLWGHEKKRIHNLSGGQQQRVALARAIVSRPEVLLLDEPLAALDLKLKEQMLVELSELQEKLGTTFVYVTHDQTEALTVADTMAIMNHNGKIEQIGSPQEIYEFPVSRFAAHFVGSTNLIEGVLRRKEDSFYVESEGLGSIEVYCPIEKNWMIPGCPLFMSIRPEKVRISKHPLEGFSNQLSGIVSNIIYYGRATQYQVHLLNGQLVIVFVQNEKHFPSEVIQYDDPVFLYFQKENIVLLEH